MTSVMPALSMATSVPVPMAMPTVASASAGASLMPSPAMATDASFALQPLDHRALLVRQDAGDHIVQTELRGDGAGGRLVVAGEHHDPQPLGVQRPDRLRGGRLDRIGGAEQPGQAGRRPRGT